jgi:hypothetical protein
METTYAIIEAGVVVNMVVWDGNTETWQPPDGSTAELLPDGSPISIGYTFDGTNFAAPVTQPSPQSAGTTPAN